MSKLPPLKIGIVAEGQTDVIVIKEIVANLCEKEFVFTVLQPESSVLFESCNAPLGTGWSGVCRWIHVTKEQFGSTLTENPVWNMFSVVILHLDTDVVDQTYEKGQLGHFATVYGDLPFKSINKCTVNKSKEVCQKQCRRPRERTDALRQIVWRWMGDAAPSNLVLCTPVESTDAWVLAAFFPKNLMIEKGRLECSKRLDGVLKSQALDQRIRKTKDDYERNVAGKLRRHWPQVCLLSSEAERFSKELGKVIDNSE